MLRKVLAVVLLVGALTSCQTARANRGMGKLAVALAMKSGEVNKLDLELTRPFLVHAKNLLETAPADLSAVLADVLAAELETWGGSLKPEERLAVEAAIDWLMAGLDLPELDDEARMAAATAAQILEGMIQGIDRILVSTERLQEIARGT